MTTWHVVTTSDPEGKIESAPAQEFEKIEDAKAAVFDACTAKGPCTIEYRKYMIYEQFTVTAGDEVFYVFIAGAY